MLMENDLEQKKRALAKHVMEENMILAKEQQARYSISFMKEHKITI